MPVGEIVFDTTCVLYMAATGHDDLLAERYAGRSYLPDEARREIEDGEAEHGHNCARVLRASWWKPLAIAEPEDQALFFELLQRWGRIERNRGEAAAIVLARRLSCLAVVDDRRGRRAAEQLAVPITGTIGILARLAADGRLRVVEGWHMVQEMVAIGFRSPLADETQFAALVRRVAEGRGTRSPGG
jgi:predicted nucleic acid-binding protein